MNALYSLHRLRYVSVIAGMAQAAGFGPGRFLRRYWQTQNFNIVAIDESGPLSSKARALRSVVAAGMLAQAAFGVVCFIWWAHLGASGWRYGAFGAALLLSYPIIWAHVLAGLLMLLALARPKKIGRAIVCTLLERQVVRLRKRYTFKVVAVAGSVGKTSTKAAIATVLQAHGRVRWQSGNYNDRVTVPLIIFGHDEPNITNVWAWLRIFMANNRTIRRGFPFDYVVAELGTDGPGYMAEFAYLEPDITVMTSIAPEHMEYFKTLDAVAAEEFEVTKYSNCLLVNRDDTAAKYVPDDCRTYGVDTAADYTARASAHGLRSQTIQLHLVGWEHQAEIALLGVQGAKAALAAAAVACELEVPTDHILKGLADITPFAGRMRVFDGIANSTVIDDTYNASPLAVHAALDVLYAAKAPQRIAILGSMNELGDTSAASHREIGAACDPSKLDMVITIGQDAKQWLAPAAKKVGCTVHSFLDPYQAGAFVAKHLKPKALVLAKGSQNGVFAEEALKQLLTDPADATKLVRQSAHWLAVKERQFGPPPKR